MNSENAAAPTQLRAAAVDSRRARVELTLSNDWADVPVVVEVDEDGEAVVWPWTTAREVDPIAVGAWDGSHFTCDAGLDAADVADIEHALRAAALRRNTRAA